jgi:hypothetical protein
MGLLEYFDDDPMATATGTRPEALSGGPAGIVLRRIGGGRSGVWRLLQKGAYSGEVLGSAAIGEQPVMPDAVQAFRQNMHQKASDELARCEGHGSEALATFGSPSI